MVQEFHVVRCFSCQNFQVQQVKKTSRWSCKLCGEKQSLLKEFGRGSGADCRRHVQKLNTMRGAKMEDQEHKTWLLWKHVNTDREDETEEQVTHSQVSCWSKYLDTPEEVKSDKEEEEESVVMGRQQLQGNNLIDRKRKASCSPEQSSWSNLMRRGPATTRTTSLNSTRSPSPNNTRAPSPNRTRAPSPNNTRAPSRERHEL